jgi:cation diffusion facilitator family transporter
MIDWALSAIHFTEAIQIAGLGLAVNIASAWLLSGEGHHHGHSHGHDNGSHDDHDGPNDIARASGTVRLEVFEDGVPPRFHLRAQSGPALTTQAASVETVRPDGTRQVFIMRDKGDFLESVAEIPEPHAFTANVRIGQDTYPVTFEEHEHAQDFAARDNNMRAAVIHVVADAAVSVLVIVGLLLARAFGWLWMDPLAGIIGACVIASWSYGLIRDTGAILLDMNPDRTMAGKLRHAVEGEGDQLADLHLWRLGPGHLGAIVSVVTAQPREANYYKSRLARFPFLSHLTVEVTHRS